MEKLIAAIYWDQHPDNQAIWFMVVDGKGYYRNFSKRPEEFKIIDAHNLEKSIRAIFDEIEDLKSEGYPVELKYKTVKKDSLSSSAEQSKAVHQTIQHHIKELGFKKRVDCFRKDEILDSQRELLGNYLKDFNVTQDREIDLWATAYHKKNFKQLTQTICKIVNKK